MCLKIRRGYIRHDHNISRHRLKIKGIVEPLLVQSAPALSDSAGRVCTVWEAWMGRLFRNMSLAGQIFAVAGFCLVITAGAALVAARTVGGIVRLELIGLLCAGSIVSIGIVMVAVRRVLPYPLAKIDAQL